MIEDKAGFKLEVLLDEDGQPIRKVLKWITSCPYMYAYMESSLLDWRIGSIMWSWHSDFLHFPQ